MKNKNEKLLQVLDAKYQDAQAKFHRIDGELNELRGESAHLRERRIDMSGMADPQAEKHTIWIEQQLMRLSSQEANLMAQRIELQRILQKAFGQREAFKAVMKKRDREAALQVSRRGA